MLELNFNPFPYMETARIHLRSISMEDAEDLFLIRKNPDAMKYIDKPLARSVDDVKVMIRKIEEGICTDTSVTWGISWKKQSGLIGTIGYHCITKEHFRAELGYMLHPHCWKQGIMKEIMPAVLDFGFRRMALHSIEANVNPSNAASIQLLEKFGFRKEAHFKENYFFEGRFLDSAIYSLLTPLKVNELS